MTDNRAVFTKYNDKYILMHIVGNRAEHIYAYDSLEKIDTGTIINCRAETHAEGIDATFVRFSEKGTGFINKAVKGQTVAPLMYKKDAFGDKKACFSDKLSISGDYAVIIRGESFIKVSSKIASDKKDMYTQHFMPFSKRYGVGIIIRTKTETEEDGIKKAVEETEKICCVLESITEKSQHTPAYTILYRPVPEFINDILYLCTLGIEEIVTDDTAIKEVLEREYETVTGSAVNVTDRVGLRFYSDDLLALCNLYSFNAKISEAMSRKVYLKSGAYITFDRTEALTSVDVNSSKSAFDSNRDDSFLRINIEAAEEICRQMRLRNLSGMIIVDFINMKDTRSYDRLKEKITQLLSEDRNNSRFIDFTGLGLCEITRKRSGRELYEILNRSE